VEAGDLVNELGARDIDEEGGRLHQGKFPPADRALAFRRNRHRNYDIVGASEHRVHHCRPAEQRHTPPVAATVHDDDPIPLGQCRDLIAPIVRIREPATRQQHRLAAAEGGVPDADAVHRA
jgi:hypothetical protein